MIVRACSRSVKEQSRRTAGELAAAVAQLPLFLVPSLALPVTPPTQLFEDRTRKARRAVNAPKAERAAPPFAPLPVTVRSKRPTTPPPTTLGTASSPPHRSSSTVARVRPAPDSVARPAASSDTKGKARAHRSDEEEAAQISWQLHTRQGTQRPDGTPDRTALPPHLDTAASADDRSPNPSIDGLPAPSLPTTSTELLQLFDVLPERPTRQDFLTLRNHAKRLDALADVDFFARFVLESNRAGYEDVGVRFFRQAVKLLVGQVPSPRLEPVAELLLSDLISRKRWSAALEISNALLSQGVSNPTLHVLRMQTLCGRGRYADAVQAFEAYGKEKDPPPRAFDVAINAHLCQADLGAAQALLAEKAKRGMPTTVETYLLLLEGMDIFGGNRPMEDKMLAAGSEEQVLAGEAPHQDVRVLNRLMSLRAARGALREALAVLDWFDLGAYPRDLVDAYRSLAIPTLVGESAPDAVARRPRPDVATVVVLAGIALRQQQPELAERLVVNALGSGSIAFNDHLAAAVLRIHLARHDVSAAETVVVKLSTGSARFGNVELPRYDPSAKVFELLFAGMLRYRGLAGANACFVRLQELFETDVAVSEGMTLALVEHLSRGPISAVGLSSAMLMQVQELTQGKVRPQAKHLDVLLKAAWRRDRLQSRALGSSALSLESEFPVAAAEQPSAPSVVPGPRTDSEPSYTPPEVGLLVKSGDNSGDTSPVSRMRESLSDRDVRHTRETTRHVIRNDHLLRFIDAKWDYLQTQVIDLGIRPSYHHVTVLMRAYLRLGDARGADNVLRYATEELGLEAHVAYYSTLISGLARLGKYDAIARVYSDFVASGLEPDRNLFAALAMSYARRRDVAAVERVLNDMRAFIRTHAPAPQIQAQALRTAASSNSTTGIPRAISMPYDPLLDAVFVNILYRAQTSAGQYLAAQDQVLHALERGMVPDLVLLKSLQRTRKWIRHKENQLERSSHGSVIHTGGPAQVDLRRDELVELKRRNAVNVSRIRKMLRRMSPPIEKKDLRDLERYWEQVENGVFEPDSHERAGQQVD
ncbi:hypothetical protein JCM3774_001780 [Rhodotorula dairenensis]